MNNYTAALNAVDNASAKLIELSDKIWATPEVAFTEVNACAWTAEVLKEYGFNVEVGVYGMPTAIRATWGSGHPVVGFLGEYDALPGMSQKLVECKDPIVPGGAGHGCAHNLLGVTCLGGAIGMKAEMEAKNLPGTIVFYGCPGEEQLTGKVFMAREGAFSELDVAVGWHGGTMNQVSIADMPGMNSAIFHFKGRTAHAGGDPHNGRSALDAAELMSVGAQYLREHVTSDVRIHYSYKEAGTAPNIVPDKAVVWYYVRAASREAVEDTYARLVKVAEGAAHMTETEVEIEFLGGCYNTMGNKVLAEVAADVMAKIGVPEYTAEELEFAHKLNLASPMYEKMKAAGALDGAPICDTMLGVRGGAAFASTDVGDVMHIVPTLEVNTASSNIAAPGHSWQVTACAGMSIGHKAMILGAKTLAVTAAKLCEDPSIVEAAKAEFDQRMNGKVYKCPIPAEIPLPYNK